MARIWPHNGRGKAFRWQKIAKWAGFIGATLFVGGFLFAWSGLYNVAASKGHWSGVEAILEFGMHSSVRTHAMGIEVPDLGIASQIERGAAHYRIGCAACHGAPGQAPSPIAQAMLPPPPDLGPRVAAWEPNELFWIVMNGLKYTGMPAWPAQGRDDEVWALVDFLQQLPTMDSAEYEALTTLDTTDAAAGSDASVETILRGCSQCHGLDGTGRPSGAFPRLDMLSASYIQRQLQDFAEGKRQSGIMQPIAVELDETERQIIAGYYAAQQSSIAVGPPRDTGSELFKLGQSLTEVGVQEDGIPPCVSCHAENAAERHPLYPSLFGQHATQIADQLALFQSGNRCGTPTARIMCVVGQRLSQEQINAVSNYLSGWPP